MLEVEAHGAWKERVTIGVVFIQLGLLLMWIEAYGDLTISKKVRILLRLLLLHMLPLEHGRRYAVWSMDHILAFVIFIFDSFVIIILII